MSKSENKKDFNKYIKKIDSMQEHMMSCFKRDREITEELSRVWKGKEAQAFCLMCDDEDEQLSSDIMKGLNNLRNSIQQKQEHENADGDKINETEVRDNSNGIKDINS